MSTLQDLKLLHQKQNICECYCLFHVYILESYERNKDFGRRAALPNGY